MLLDPPSLIFLMRLHLTSVARRKIAAAQGRGPRGAHSSSKQHRPHIPPPIQLPAWAAQEMAQLHGGSVAVVQQPSQGGRTLLDAPDVLCCPITGQVRPCCVMDAAPSLHLCCSITE